jgi:hypothetical protein
MKRCYHPERPCHPELVEGSHRTVAVLVVCFALLAGCAKYGSGTGAIPSASPSAGPTIAPGSCNTNPSTNPNVVIVGIGSEVTEVTDPTYGQIAGYAVFDDTDIPDLAQVISKTALGNPITSSNTVQFTNIELGTDEIEHSAVAFSGHAFPAEPYTFSSNALNATNTVIGNTAQPFWSTGRIPPAQNGELCYSQEFTLEPGTYYFGDLDYYNTVTSYRDVLVVQQ